MPLFVLTDSSGEPITRWPGYSDAARFIGTLSAALSDPITVSARAERFSRSASAMDAFFLARYYTGVKEYSQGVRYYRDYQRLTGPTGIDVTYDWFKAVVEAAWQGDLPFDSAAGAFEILLRRGEAKADETIAATKILARLARKTERETDLEPFLKAAIHLAESGSSAQSKRDRHELQAEYLFHVHNDTGAAIDTFRASLCENWRNDPTKLYFFGHWCVERRVNYSEARECLTRSAREGPEPIASASVYDLARIFEYRDRYDEAQKMLRHLVEQYAYNPFYEEELERVSKLVGAVPAAVDGPK